MPRFMVEIQHGNDKEGCLMALHAIVKHGSHLITQADFGCEDGEHCGWLIIDVDSHEDAMRVVPPQFRNTARIVQLRKWTKEEIEQMVDGLES